MSDAADDGEDGGRLRVAGDHAVGHQRRVDREGVAPAPRDPGHGGVEAAGVVVPDRDAVAHREARGVLDRDLLLAEVAVERQRRDGRVGLAQDRLALPAADRDVRAEVQRVAHQVLALADLDDPTAQAGDVIDGRLEYPVVGPDQSAPARPTVIVGRSLISECMACGSCRSSGFGARSSARAMLPETARTKVTWASFCTNPTDRIVDMENLLKSAGGPRLLVCKGEASSVAEFP